ncbi:TPA: FISUMP domain-containing protein [Elizabethkingia anophelis]
MRKNTLTNALAISLPAILLWFSVSCRSSDADNKTLNNEAVTINVNLAQDEYKDVTNNLQTSVNKILSANNNLIQAREVPFAGGFSLVAELKPDTPSLKNTTQASLSPVTAAIPILRAIKFRVVVYNASGQYDSSYNYSISATGAVTPDSGIPMKLNGGQSYTFIAYSYNTNVAPADNLIGSNLSTATIPVTSTQDIMYYKTTMTPSGNTGEQNNLNVVLKHIFSTITVAVDSSLTNYKITNITGATLGKTFPTATIALNSGAVTSSGGATTANVDFPASPDSNKVTATSAVMLNNSNNTNDGTFKIASLTVGPLTGTNVTFNNLTIQPGVRYTMTMRIIPQDSFFDDTTSVPGQTIKAARINGKVWMRHNLGADYSLDPDQSPSIAQLHGNYYQWGRKTVVATAFTPPDAIPEWGTTPGAPDVDAWSTGTEDAPVKIDANDPCPNGYRVPTTKEFKDLIEATTQLTTDNIGAPWVQSASNYATARVFRSKRNANIKLTFPMAGLRDTKSGNLLSNISGSPSRGVAAYLWGSFRSGGYSSEMDISQTNVNGNSGANNKNWGMSIRCIGVN